MTDTPTIPGALKAIRSSRDKTEATRDALIELKDRLSSENARPIFEAAFGDVLDPISEDDRIAIYDFAWEQSERLLETYNEYVLLLKVVEAATVGEYSDYQRPRFELSNEVASSENRIQTAFSLLRSHKDLTEGKIRGILEEAFPKAVDGLPEEARNTLFEWASERSSASGNLTLANYYIDISELIREVRSSKHISMTLA